MEWEDFSPTHSLWEQSSKRYRNEIWCTVSLFAVDTFVEKYRAYLGSAPFKLRVDNRALAWLKTYSMDQS